MLLLHDCLDNYSSMKEVDDIFQSCTHLGEELDEIKRCHVKHSEVNF